MSDVWVAIHHLSRSGNDVAVAASRAGDPEEWERAHYGALVNMRNAMAEAERWAGIADEMRTGWAEVDQRIYEDERRRLERRS